jgi:hypothetical protein
VTLAEAVPFRLPPLKEGLQLVTNCHQLKLLVKDSERRLSEAAIDETLLPGFPLIAMIVLSAL